MTSNPKPIPTLLALLLTLLPSTAAAVPSNRSIALEGSLPARAGGQPAVALSSGCWLEWELELLARLTLGSAPRPEGRGAAASVTPEVGLRWAPDEGRWRPVLAILAGVRIPTAGRATAPTAALQAGAERLLGEGWAAVATLGARFTASERAAGEAALGLRLYF